MTHERPVSDLHGIPAAAKAAGGGRVNVRAQHNGPLTREGRIQPMACGSRAVNKRRDVDLTSVICGDARVCGD